MIKLFEYISECAFYVFALFASLFSMAASDKDYKFYPTEERIEYVSENIDAFTDFAEYAFEYTDGVSAISSVYDYEIENKSGSDFSEISNKIDERVNVYHRNGIDYVKIDFLGGTPGYSSSGVYYTEQEIYMSPGSCTEAEYDEATDKYIVYNAANSVEIIKITDHWYFFQVAFYDDDGFTKKP